MARGQDLGRRQGAGIAFHAGLAGGVDHVGVGVGRDHHPAAGAGDRLHLLNGQDGARAHGRLALQRAGHGGDAFHRLGRVQRHLDPVDAGIDQRPGHRHGVGGGDAPQDGDQRTAHWLPPRPLGPIAFMSSGRAGVRPHPAAPCARSRAARRPARVMASASAVSGASPCADSAANSPPPGRPRRSRRSAGPASRAARRQARPRSAGPTAAPAPRRARPR